MSTAQFNLKIAEIGDDREHGASELARRCLKVLAEAAEALQVSDVLTLQEQLQKLADELAQTRPSMAPVQNLLRRWREESMLDDKLDLTTARTVAARQAEALIAVSHQAVAACAAHAAQFFGPGRTLMTHSLSSTVLQVCQLLRNEDLHVIVTESRPLAEGRSLAEKLADWGVPTVYITDAQMGLWVAQADAVLVGADSVLADGAVVNKAGTYLLALAAHDQNVPFYVCCESFKWRKAGEPSPKLEEMAPAELETPEWPGVTVRNIYFDITPARLVSAWISETGVQSIDRINQH